MVEYYVAFKNPVAKGEFLTVFASYTLWGIVYSFIEFMDYVYFIEFTDLG